MVSKGFWAKIVISLSLLLSFQLYVPSAYGASVTTTETMTSITIPMQQWNALKNELNLLNTDLMVCQQELTMLKKPSQTLVEELTQAQALRKKLETELTECKADLTVLSNEVGELKTLSQTLKTQINKERAIHKRQIWQNRMWFLLIGVGVVMATK